MVSSGPDTGTNAQRQYFQLHHDVGPLAADGSVEIVPPRRSAARHNMRDAAIQHCRAASAPPSDLKCVQDYSLSTLSTLPFITP